MDRVTKDEDYMLYALLAGGAPYLVRDGAYPNTDGAFDGEKISLEEMAKRCRVVTELHEKRHFWSWYAIRALLLTEAFRKVNFPMERMSFVTLQNRPTR